MERAARIKETFERNAKAMALRPSLGQGTAKTKVTLRDGLTCDVEDGNWKLVVDMSPTSGGDSRGPDPGVYGRAALGSCLAIGYTLWAAKLGVVLKKLEVEVQADYDSRPNHGVTDDPPGYRQVRYIVTVESDAPEAAVMRVLDQADACSPLRDDFARALDVRREVRVTNPEPGTENDPIMDARLQRRVQRYGWDKASLAYEQFWRRPLAPAQERVLALADVAPGADVLDVACGTGLVTFPAARAAGAAGLVVGVDLSQEMVNLAAEQARTLGLAQVRFERMDAEALTFDAASFDVALCALGLMYVPEPQKAITEMHRVLRPGGRAVVAVWGARNRCGWAEIFPIVDRRVASEVCPMFFQLGTGDMLRHVFEAAGFTEVRVERISAMIEYASADDAVGAAFAGGPVALAYARFEAQVRNEVHAEYLDSLAPYRDAGGAGYEVPGEFVIARGIRA